MPPENPRRGMPRLYKGKIPIMLQTERHFFAPGRVNLIGDHTDYNGGLVFPAALNMGTYLTVKQHDDANLCRFISENDSAEFLIRKEELSQKRNSWVDYPLGVIKEFTDRGFPVSGLQFHYRGDLPIGAALRC